jgi:spore germination cell wall hydrolase CwlJ-like protein
MTTTVVTQDRQVQIEHHQNIAQGLAIACSAVLIMLGIWIATSLLGWAIHHRDIVSDVPTNTQITMAMREQQLGCLTKNIYYEAGSEPFEGKVAVAQVTLNRAQQGGFPDDVCKVIYQKNAVYNKVLCQFSWVCENASGMKPVNKTAYAESEAVAKKVLLEGFRLPSLKDALYFHGDYINPGWRKEKVAHIGRHIFYR